MASVTRYETPTGWFELVRHEPGLPLRPHVSAIWGFEERAGGPVRRLEVPYPEVIVDIGFGPQVRIDAETHRSFVAGLHDTAVRTEHQGEAHGVELAITPLGARMLFGVPMHELATRTVELDDLVGPDAARLADGLYSAPTWEARFALLERALAARIAEAERPRPEVAWAWRQLTASSGRVPVGHLTDELGWSRKRLVTQFREHVGLAPKTFARVLRFGRAVRLLRDGLGWAELAHDCGYYDQAHFNRDFREFAGVTPSEFARRLSPDDPGVAAD